jgi:glycosyltransferase involved in cell wall biosynthesis
MGEPKRTRLLVTKGSFEHYGGGERDLLNNLAGWQEHFDITVATLFANEETRQRLDELGIQLFTPVKAWSYSSGVWAEMRAKSSRKASRTWYSMLQLTEQGPSLATIIANVDAVNITSGVGSMEVIEYLPADLPVHTHMLEPDRGLYSTDLHYRVDGMAKQNLTLTGILLAKQRRIDQKLLLKASTRGRISGNSKHTAARIKEVYGIDAGVLYPSINPDIWPEKASEKEDWPAVSKLYGLGKGEYVINIGRSMWAKGIWDTISCLKGLDIALVQLGGGVDQMVHEHAKSCGVTLHALPRISQEELCTLMRHAKAMVSHARNEPFGMTVPESYAMGCPVIVADEGGFTETVIDGQTGRLLPRNGDWHAAIAQADEEKEKWTVEGRKHIVKMDLTVAGQSKRLADIISEMLT